MRLSFSIMRSKLSAISEVLLNDVPIGVYISTANWLRSATGISSCGSLVISHPPNIIVPKPTAKAVRL